ncbi:hypothetical protein SODALDRAFT_359911 [Sodiomyces alkalinus F11]|uniref:Uncharacterized protein n=1 Tax=Sodiomyces alkalinus (strain CBS 110278 / VKM F-3762 / F11) TaxID=1314773 RepID=A0A3N2PWA9_SODAK|nr:hypothetical protein SODALDRAFT_359911 [Sodiomyces alkalinus F11]ROT38803.1 hypothetical protein SODALDRAFT_359911 [Sodiomyces alkalinus F11]
MEFPILSFARLSKFPPSLSSREPPHLRIRIRLSTLTPKHRVSLTTLVYVSPLYLRPDRLGHTAISSSSMDQLNGLNRCIAKTSVQPVRASPHVHSRDDYLVLACPECPGTLFDPSCRFEDFGISMITFRQASPRHGLQSRGVGTAVGLLPVVRVLDSRDEMRNEMRNARCTMHDARRDIGPGRLILLALPPTHPVVTLLRSGPGRSSDNLALDDGIPDRKYPGGIQIIATEFGHCPFDTITARTECIFNPTSTSSYLLGDATNAIAIFVCPPNLSTLCHLGRRFISIDDNKCFPCTLPHLDVSISAGPLRPTATLSSIATLYSALLATGTGG